MTRPFLFGGSSNSQSQNKYLVEFRAGKMTMKDKMVHADKRKGLVFIHQTDDSLMHFCWKDRTTGTVEDDLIIFPDDVVFKRVPECTTGRVYVLKFKSSSRRCFYWLQEPKTDRDNEFCCKVNQYLNNPPAGSSRSGVSGSMGGSSTPSQSGGGLQSELSSLGDGDLQNLLNNMSQQQLIQLLGGVGGMSGMASLSNLLGASRPSSGQSTSSATESRTITEASQPATTTSSSITTQSSQSTTSSATSSQPNSSIQLSDLQNILSGLNVPAQPGNSQTPSVDLSSAITAEALQPLFNNQELMERIQNLLPPSTETGATLLSDQLRSTVQSPQFQQDADEDEKDRFYEQLQDILNSVKKGDITLVLGDFNAKVGTDSDLWGGVMGPFGIGSCNGNGQRLLQALSVFSAALQSGQLGPLMQQFGMNEEVVNAANSGDMDAFVRALQSSQQERENTSEGGTTDASAASKEKDQDKDEDMSLD